MAEMLDGAVLEELGEFIEFVGGWFAGVPGGGPGCLLVGRLRWCWRGLRFNWLRVEPAVERA